MKPCLGCGKPTQASRCSDCRPPAPAWNEAKRLLYGSADYRRRAKQVRDTATNCWICGQGPKTGDPWQADHAMPGDPASPLLPAHRSCNASRANRSRAKKA